MPPAPCRRRHFAPSQRRLCLPWLSVQQACLRPYLDAKSMSANPGWRVGHLAGLTSPFEGVGHCRHRCCKTSGPPRPPLDLPGPPPDTPDLLPFSSFFRVFRPLDLPWTPPKSALEDPLDPCPPSNPGFAECLP